MFWLSQSSNQNFEGAQQLMRYRDCRKKLILHPEAGRLISEAAIKRELLKHGLPAQPTTDHQGIGLASNNPTAFNHPPHVRQCFRFNALQVAPRPLSRQFMKGNESYSRLGGLVLNF